MVDQVYTHTFEIKSTDHTINGEIEFNRDGISSYKTNAPLAGIQVQEMRAIQALFQVLTDLYKELGGLEKVEFVEK